MNSRARIPRQRAPAPVPAKSRIATPDAVIEDLAQVVWKMEGGLADRRNACRREVELQLLATRSLLARELGSAADFQFEAFGSPLSEPA